MATSGSAVLHALGEVGGSGPPQLPVWPPSNPGCPLAWGSPLVRVIPTPGKFLFYIHRVAREVCLSSTCLLSIFQAITIIPSKSRWAELKARVPKYIGPLCAPPRHAHGDLTSLAPHERLPENLVVPREKSPTDAAARGNPWKAPVLDQEAGPPGSPGHRRRLSRAVGQGWGPATPSEGPQRPGSPKPRGKGPCMN